MTTTSPYIVAQENSGSLEQAWSVKTLVEFHQRIKSSLGVQDIYKMLYQSNFGVEHILADTGTVRNRLLDEVRTIGVAREHETLLERISTSGKAVRVNLRPFKALNLDPHRLVQVIYQSAAIIRPDTIGFYREWNQFTALVRFDLLHFPQEEIHEWDVRVARGDLGPVHHSSEYARANAPAYRVVSREVFEAMFQVSVGGSE